MHELIRLLQSAEPDCNEDSQTQRAGPNEWFTTQFPKIAEKYGTAVQCKSDRIGGQYVAEISDDYFAALLGELGTPQSPTVFVREEARYCRYSPVSGIYEPCTDGELQAAISDLLHRYSVESGQELNLRLRSPARLRGVVERARTRLGVDGSFFTIGNSDFVACRNGLLRLSDSELLPFAPEQRRRNKLTVDYVPGATCPVFLDTLLKPALADEDIDLVRQFFGLAVLGVNLAQALLILVGRGGDGKGVLINVLSGVVGRGNVGTLRPNHLLDRFELSGLLGRTLLYGADVNSQFLRHSGASVIKSLTGGDPVSVELKGSNHRVDVCCKYNILVTCNEVPTVMLDGDKEAWRRRLHIIAFKPQQRAANIPDLADRILRQEGSGVLNFALEGLHKLRSNNFNILRSPAQEALVAAALGQSASMQDFITAALERCEGEALLELDCYSAYVAFCAQRGWSPQARADVIEAVKRHLLSLGIRHRHDLLDAQGRGQRGWIGVRINTPDRSDNLFKVLARNTQ